MRRLALLAIGALLLAAVLGGIATSIANTTWGAGRPDGHPGFWGWPLLLLLLIGLVLVARRMRRMTTPTADLVEAAGRIQEGDYSVRVTESGSPEVRSVARALNAMTEQLEATDKRRRSFLADVTHELRTPLSIIRGQAEGIADGLYPADATHVSPIVDATQTLERLVDDLRTLALAETGNLRLNREAVDLGVLLNDSIASFAPQAQAKGVSLQAEVEEEMPSVSADPVRVRSVIANLLGNAIGHTPAGGSVRVTARRSDKGLTVSVSDTGEGIPAELLPRIFDRFVKSPGSRGSGLGLAIARDTVAAHGGTITAESQLGRGTTVQFGLPLA
jgi:two-component system sensor histidine kinase BaeS